MLQSLSLTAHYMRDFSTRCLFKTWRWRLASCFRGWGHLLPSCRNQMWLWFPGLTWWKERTLTSCLLTFVHAPWTCNYTSAFAIGSQTHMGLHTHSQLLQSKLAATACQSHIYFSKIVFCLWTPFVLLTLSRKKSMVLVLLWKLFWWLLCFIFTFVVKEKCLLRRRVVTR